MDNVNETPCEPCEAEAENAGYNLSQNGMPLRGFGSLDAPNFPEPTQENLILAVKKAADIFGKEMDRHLELQHFLEENDVPNSLVEQLFWNYQFYF